MHGAGVDGILGLSIRGSLDQIRVEIFRRIADELGAASGGTEIIGVPTMIRLERCCNRVNGHAADRINREQSRYRGLCGHRCHAVMGMVMAGMLSHGHARRNSLWRLVQSWPWSRCAWIASRRSIPDQHRGHARRDLRNM